jgi:hypothetical protein
MSIGGIFMEVLKADTTLNWLGTNLFVRERGEGEFCEL